MKTLCAVLISVSLVLAGVGAVHPQAPVKLSPALERVLTQSAESDPLAVWVFLTDKGGDHQSKLAEVEASLTSHARARRLRNRRPGNLVDTRDIAVETAHIEAIRQRGARVRHISRWLNAVSVELEAEAVERIASLSFVDRMDIVRTGKNPLPEPTEDTGGLGPQRAPSFATLDYGASFAQNDVINVPPVHDMGYSGSGVWICIMDAGFNNLQHEAFQSLDVLIAYDFVSSDSIVSDEAGQPGSGDHGTRTLSTIAGYKPGELIGPAFGATYILARTENTDWERHVEEDAWVAAAEWADSIGADIITSSVGYSTGFTNGDTDYHWSDLDGNTTIIAIGADIAASRGILVVNSAGNDGLVAAPANSLISPSDGDSVLCVGAVDSANRRASFSSVGPTADGRIKPDVMGMGLGVRAASVSTGYVSVSGTSFSCPLVAGAAALILEGMPTSTNAEIVQALRQTASRASAPDREMGWGIVDTDAALAVVTGTDSTPPPENVALYPAFPNPFNPTTTIEYDIPSSIHVRLDIYDVRGAIVATLVDEVQGEGRKSVLWRARNQNGDPARSGVYFYRLVAGGVRESRKLVLLR